MKWFFIFLLLVNVTYLGWETDRNAKQYRANKQTAIKIPASATRLQLVSELKLAPQPRQVEPVLFSNFEDTQVTSMLPIEMNPNTENMVQSLLGTTELNEFDNQMTAFDSAVSATSDNEGITICYTYGPIPEENESRLMSDWLSEREIQHEQRQTREDGQPKFWVYLAPQASKAEAEQALAELREKGISDMQLIRSGDLLNAVSLGLFSTQAAVNRRLNEIKATGYSPVVVPYAGGRELYWFDVKLVQNSSYVNELFTGFPARFKALPVDCDEIAMRLRNP